MLQKRPDGFHEIASLYQAITFGDFLTITPSHHSDTLSCNLDSLPTDQTNLILRAAELFREKTGTNSYFSFSLDKRIPIESGLGGGSSNAATTLWGINTVVGAKIETETLAEWAAELGSDVPFFLSHGRAYCKGRGEILEAELQAPTIPLWIAKPMERLSTLAVYKGVNLENLKQRDPEEALHSHRTDHPHFFNDLEESAFQLVPQLHQTKQALLRLGFDQVQMTGSGTAFFCFGKIVSPSLPQVDFYPAQFIYREEGGWYKFPG